MGNKGVIRPIDHQLGMLQRAVDVLLIFLTLFVTLSIYLSLSGWNGQYTMTVLTTVTIFYIAAEHNGLYQSYRFEKLTGELKPLFIACPRSLACCFWATPLKSPTNFLVLYWVVGVSSRLQLYSPRVLCFK